MGQNDIIRAFGEWKIRVSWEADEEKWYFSIVDVVGALTEHLLRKGPALIGPC